MQVWTDYKQHVKVKCKRSKLEVSGTGGGPKKKFARKTNWKSIFKQNLLNFCQTGIFCNILRETNSNALNDNLEMKKMQTNNELQEHNELCQERLDLNRQNFELKQLKYKLLKKNSS